MPSALGFGRLEEPPELSRARLMWMTLTPCNSLRSIRARLLRNWRVEAEVAAAAKGKSPTAA
jgi:hypothetical protein